MLSSFSLSSLNLSPRPHSLSSQKPRCPPLHHPRPVVGDGYELRGYLVGVGAGWASPSSSPKAIQTHIAGIIGVSLRLHRGYIRLLFTYGTLMNHANSFWKKNHVARERQSCLQMGWRSLHRWDTAAGLPSSNTRRRSSESQSNNKERRRYPRRSQKDAHDKDIRRLCSSYHRFSSRNYDVQKVIEIPKRIPIPRTNCYC